MVFGLSGGIDSAVIAYLCNNAIKDKTLAIIMPDSKVSPESETNDAIQIVDKLGIDYKLLDINLTGSICSIVGPDVTKALFPVKIPGLRR